MFKFDLSTFAGLVAVAGFVPYIISILRGTTKPAKASWVVWAALDWIIMLGLIAKHAVTGQIIGYVIGASATALLALKYGTPGWTKIDKLSLALVGAGVIIWKMMDDPAAAVLTSLMVMVIGSGAAFINVWKNPAGEDRLAWTIFWTSSVMAIPTITKWTVTGAATPIAFLILQSLFLGIIIFRPRFLPATTAEAR